MNKYVITIIYTQQKKFSTIQENFRKRISRNLRNVSRLFSFKFRRQLV